MGIEDPEAKCKPSKGRPWPETRNKGEVHSKTFIKAGEQLGIKNRMGGVREEGGVRGGPGRGVSEEQGMGLGSGQRGIREGPGEGSGEGVRGRGQGRGQGEVPRFCSTLKGCEKQVPDLRGSIPRRG